MNKSRVSFWLRAVLIAGLALLGVMTVANDVLAFGSIRMKRTTIEEADGRWKFDMDVDYGSKPHLGHIPFDFVFELKTYFEYSITDTDKQPVVRPKPMHNQQPQREQLDLGFADARGDVWRQTKFSFSLLRDRGFSAGEYTLTVRRSSDGAMLGRPIHVTLKGQNELIDRRAIVFAGERKKTKKEPAEGSKAPTAAGDKADSGGDSPSDKPGESKTTNEPAGKQGADDIETPQTIEERPGGHGCGCRTAGGGASGTIGLCGLSALGLVAAARRRKHTPQAGAPF
ncbi:MAG: hypothetical protein MUF54_04305 [Polyangiaceae bacterium]|jgi:MYXO-CTERM domain-containing protein|nr:hypothetical protein [Polyangiaceae bacterium]